MDLTVVIWIPIITAIITLVFNVLLQWFQKNMNRSEDKKKFKREHNYNQLKQLYLPIYGMVVQSEYIRHFNKKYKKVNYSLKEFPFLEVQSSRTTMRGGVITKEEIKNAITEFNKKEIVDLIISKCEFSSRKLLKPAVAYRFIEFKYISFTLN